MLSQRIGKRYNKTLGTSVKKQSIVPSLSLSDNLRSMEAKLCMLCRRKSYKMDVQTLNKNDNNLKAKLERHLNTGYRDTQITTSVD